MNKKSLIIFITFILGIYLLVNYYIFLRGWQALAGSHSYRLIYEIIFSVLFISYPLSRFLERTFLVKISEPVIWLGSLWLAAMLYFFLAVLSIDIIRAADYFFNFIPEAVFCPCNNIKLLLFIIISSFTFLLIIAGFINARRPVIKKLNLDIQKKVTGMKSLRIAAVSDIHIGMIIKHRMVGRLARMIKSINPDVVLFAGDVIDEVIDPVIKYNLGAPLSEIKAPLGLYGITGNHEFIGGAKKSVAYIESLGIKMLLDEVVKISDSFYIVGRIDHDIIRFTNKKRKELSGLLIDVDTSLPIILLDHQPFNLDKTAACEIDLQISGHTHHGQLWPFNYVTKAIYKISQGYLKKGNTHIYVSCGFGTWGPPIRIGNRPEILDIKLNFIPS